MFLIGITSELQRKTEASWFTKDKNANETMTGCLRLSSSCGWLTNDCRVELDPAPLGGQRHGGLLDAVVLLQGRLDQEDARGAGHAADLEKMTVF